MNGDRGLHRDQRGLMGIAFMIRLVLYLSIIGLIAYEGAQIAIAQAHAHTVARAAAQAAANSYFIHKNADQARAAASETLKELDPKAKIVSLRIRPDGVAVVRTEVVADTLVVREVGFLKDLGVQEATEQQGHTGP